MPEHQDWFVKQSLSCHEAWVWGPICFSSKMHQDYFWNANTLGARTLLGAPGRTTSNKKLLVTKGIATNGARDAWTLSILFVHKKLLGAKSIATRNKKLLGAPGRTTSNKKLLVTKGIATNGARDAWTLSIIFVHKKLLGAKGIATRNKKLLGAPGRTTRSKGRYYNPFRLCSFRSLRTSPPKDFWGDIALDLPKEQLERPETCRQRCNEFHALQYTLCVLRTKAQLQTVRLIYSMLCLMSLIYDTILVNCPAAFLVLRCIHDCNFCREQRQLLKEEKPRSGAAVKGGLLFLACLHSNTTLSWP